MANEELFYSGIDGQNRGLSKNFRHLKRTGTVASSATPTINTDVVDYYSITALAANITSFTTNLTGTPNDADELVVSITDDGTARTIAWGSAFEASAEALPTTTIISERMDILFRWNTVTSKWRLIDVTTTSSIPSASEITAGIAELATQAETNTGTDDLRIVTPLKLATNLGTKFSNGTIGDGATQNPVYNHALNTQNVSVTARLNASPYTKVEITWKATDANNVTFYVAGAPLTTDELAVHVSRI
jgi:hypothetical protein